MADITKINLNGTNYNLVDSAATSAIASEVSRAQGAESAITSALSAEVVARQSADTALEQAIAAKADSASTYTKTEVDTALAAKANTATTYTKSEVDTALAGKQNTLSAGTGIQISGDVISCTVDTGLYVVVQTLPAQPAAGNENKIHLVPLPASATGQNDQYEEYLWKGTEWEYLGVRQAEIDLSDYWTSAQTQSAITAATSGLASTGYVDSAVSSATENVVEWTDDEVAEASDAILSREAGNNIFVGLRDDPGVFIGVLAEGTDVYVGEFRNDEDEGTGEPYLNFNRDTQKIVSVGQANAEYDSRTETLIINLPATPSE